MPFSIGPALTALSPLLTGLSPGLGTVARALGAGFTPPAYQSQPVAAVGPIISGLGRAAIGGAVGGAIESFLGFGGGNGSPGRLRSILNAASQSAGKRITSKAIVASVKSIGIEATADALGISTTDVAFVFVARRRRHARGISASDLRRTKSTIRKVRSIEKSLGIHHGGSRGRRAVTSRTSIVKA